MNNCICEQWWSKRLNDIKYNKAFFGSQIHPPFWRSIPRNMHSHWNIYAFWTNSPRPVLSQFTALGFFTLLNVSILSYVHVLFPVIHLCVSHLKTTSQIYAKKWAFAITRKYLYCCGKVKQRRQKNEEQTSAAQEATVYAPPNAMRRKGLTAKLLQKRPLHYRQTSSSKIVTTMLSMFFYMAVGAFDECTYLWAFFFHENIWQSTRKISIAYYLWFS